MKKVFVFFAAFAFSNAAHANQTISIPETYIDVGCSINKTAMGPIGADAGVPDALLVFSGIKGLGGKYDGAFFFAENSHESLVEGAVLALDEKKVYLQSSMDPNNKIFVGNAKFAPRDVQELLPRCQIRTPNRDSQRSVKIEATPLSLEFTKISRACVKIERKIDESRNYEMMDGNFKLEKNQYAATFIPKIMHNFEISDGHSRLSISKEVLTSNQLWSEKQFFGFQSAENCQNYVDAFKL